MKMAVIQMVSTARVGDNLQAARAAVAQAAQQGAELVVLPEYFCLMGLRDTDKRAVQEPWGDGPIQHAMAEAARAHGLWLVAGTLPLQSSDPQRVFNSSLAFSPQGECVVRYDKIHLFRLDNGSEQFDEARTIMHGQQPVAFELPSRDGHCWRVGLSVCYDLRFPELYRALQADLLLVPSAFTWGTGQAHWELLLRARAVENLAFVGAPAQGGTHDSGRRTWGHSMIIDPWGQVLAQCDDGPAVVCCELDAAQLAQRRAQLPALAHRTL